MRRLEVHDIKLNCHNESCLIYLTHIEWYGMKLRNTCNFVVRSSSESRDRRTFQFIPSGLASVGTELLTRVRQGRYLRWEPKNLKWAGGEIWYHISFAPRSSGFESPRVHHLKDACSKLKHLILNQYKLNASC